MHRSRVGAILLAAACASSLGTSARGRDAADGFIAAYVAPEGGPGPVESVSDLTVRQILRFEAAGSMVRVAVGNQLGSDTVHAEHMHIQLLDPHGVPIAGSDRRLAFGPSQADSVALAPGTMQYSAPIRLAVSRGQVAAITTYYPAQSSHRIAYVKDGYSAHGDHTADPVPITSNPGGGLRGIVQRVEVMPTAAKQVLVAIGDSITAGYNSTPFAQKSYPEQVTDRFASLPGGVAWSVVNAGISGNRVLHDGNGPCLLSRFSRDALEVPGVAAVLVLEGVNDIGHPIEKKNAADPQPVSAQQIESAFGTLVAQAHSHGVRIYFGTILPYGVSGYYSDTGEATRVEVNRWIRTNADADGYVELALPMLDPGSAPPRIKPALSGKGDPSGVGGLHPDDAGYRLMAEQVSPTIIAASRRSTTKRLPVSAPQGCLTD